MLILNRACLPTRLAATVFVTISITALMGCSSQPNSPARGNHATVIERTHADGALLPGFANLSPDQLLDRSLTLPGMRGIVRGHVEATISMHNLTIPASDQQNLVTDFAFLVEAYYGHGSPPYPLGSTISLRVPGGAIGNIISVTENAPTVTPGMEIFVFVRDQGTVAGGNTSTVLVASSTADVLRVVGDKVVGQGSFAAVAESLPQFLTHFNH